LETFIAHLTRRAPMERKAARLTLAAGIVVIGLGIIAYTFYFNRAAPEQPTPALKGGEEVQQAVQKEASLPSAEGNKEMSPKSQEAESVSENADQPSPENEKVLLEAARKALDDPDVATRVQIVRQLRYAESEEAIETLYTFLYDDNPAVIKSALNSLAFVGKDGLFKEKVYDILIEKAKDQQFNERGQALVIASMYEPDPKVFAVISDFITEEDKNGTKKAYAVKALAAIATPNCIAYLNKILEGTTDPNIQKEALYTLSRIENDQAVATLQDKLTSQDSQTQLDTSWALAQQNKPEYNQMLSEVISNRKLNDDAIAVVARSPAGPVLLKDVLANDNLDRQEKVSILNIYAGNMTLTTNDVRTGVMDAVRPLVDSDDPDLQVQAIKIMGMGFGSEETAEVLNPKLRSSDTRVRNEALNAYLPYIGPENYKPVLDMIWDKDETIRRHALAYAQQYVDDSDRPLLEKALNHEDEAIRKSVSQILN